MPLKLSLRPGEAVIVNGAVIRNGDRRGSVLLQNKARVMREKDVVFPEQLKSAAMRIYFSVMQLYLTGEIEGPYLDHASAALAEAISETDSDAWRAKLIDVSAALAAGETYKALSLSRKLLREDWTDDG
ncbi:MAG: flagellar biosynthesis repressor FlbT [Pseudomonadota bacterium]